MSRETATLGVLIIEDEALLALDLEAIIHEAGHRVVGDAMCLADLKALGDLESPELAFVDLHLADGDLGTDACCWIRERWPSTLIVFVTANAGELGSDFGGGHGVIPKPFSQAGVTAALRYLEQAISDPPPSLEAPSSFSPSPDFVASFAA